MWRAIISRSGGKPSVVLYWSAIRPLVSSTASAASFISSTGKRSGPGRPPANEMMSGCAVSFSSSRMTELVIRCVRCA